MSHANETAPTSHRQGGHRDESPSKWTAFVFRTIADIAAAFVGLRIVLHLLGVNQATLFVQYVRDMAYWLAGWSQHVYTVENEHLSLVLNYALPALVYLFIGHGIAAKIRHPRRPRTARDAEPVESRGISTGGVEVHRSFEAQRAVARRPRDSGI